VPSSTTVVWSIRLAGMHTNNQSGVHLAKTPGLIDLMATKKLAPHFEHELQTGVTDMTNARHCDYEPRHTNNLLYRMRWHSNTGPYNNK
jgi:hypothetical protein